MRARVRPGVTEVAVWGLNRCESPGRQAPTRDGAARRKSHSNFLTANGLQVLHQEPGTGGQSYGELGHTNRPMEHIPIGKVICIRIHGPHLSSHSLYSSTEILFFLHLFFFSLCSILPQSPPLPCSLFFPAVPLPFSLYFFLPLSLFIYLHNCLIQPLPPSIFLSLTSISLRHTHTHTP